MKAVLGLGASIALAVLLPSCSHLFDSEDPIPFEISKVVMPRDIPPPGDERNSYPDSRELSGSKSSKEPSEKDLSARRAAAEEQERLHAALASKATPSDLVKVKLPGSGEGAFLTSKSFVTRWNVLGPIPAALPQQDVASADPLQVEYVANEKELEGSINAPAGSSWNPKVFSDATAPGSIDLSSVFGSDSSACAYYATACLDCPESIEGARLLIASSMPIKVWLNGVLVHTFDRGVRELKLDQDSIDGIHLKRGYNRLVVKCVGVQGESGRKFMLRFATSSGAQIPTEP